MVIGAFAAIAHEPELQRERERGFLERECWSLEEEICYAACARSDAAKPKREGGRRGKRVTDEQNRRNWEGIMGNSYQTQSVYKSLGLEISELGLVIYVAILLFSPLLY